MSKKIKLMSMLLGIGMLFYGTVNAASITTSTVANTANATSITTNTVANTVNIASIVADVWDTTNIYHQIVNKKSGLAKDYKPKELVVPKVKFSFSGNHEKKYLEKEAALALEKLFAAASKEKHTLVAISGYRSYTRQNQIYSQNVKRYGEKVANRSSAKPGQSEHQTGLAMDISAKSVGYNLTEGFAQTKEGKWVKENGHRYGFIIRYPKGKEEITGYVYEPWHIRYVGEELATLLYENDLTLEELQAVSNEYKIEANIK